MSDPVAMYVGELIRDGHRQGFLFRAPGLQFIFPIRNPRTGMPAWQKRFRIIRPGTTDSDRELKEMTSVTHRDDYFILEYKISPYLPVSVVKLKISDNTGTTKERDAVRTLFENWRKYFSISRVQNPKIAGFVVRF